MADALVIMSSGFMPLDTALASAGLAETAKPNLGQLKEIKEILGRMDWPSGYQSGPCVLAAWLGGAADGGTIASIIEADPLTVTGSAQKVCSADTNWLGYYRSVSDYLDVLRSEIGAPKAAALIEVAGSATAKAAAAKADAEAKDDAKKIAADVGHAVAWTGLGLGTLALFALAIYLLFQKSAARALGA